MSDISIIGVAEGNLKNISLDIPRNKLVVFTGLSGSGKSTLLIDVLYNECQRQYLEAMAFQGIHKPKVERVRGASPAIVITQTDANRNPRSTVGTMSDIYTDLRMVYEKLGSRRCPSVSYTHLDVYKRQIEHRAIMTPVPGGQPGVEKAAEFC